MTKTRKPYIYRYGNEQKNTIPFSVREAQCANYFKGGQHTIGEIAQLLKISPNTVEYYLNNMKMKLGCYDKHDLIEILKNLDLG